MLSRYRKEPSAILFGPTCDQTTVMCKSDQTPLILAACKRLGFVHEGHEGTLGDRVLRNSQLERGIRTVEVIDRATHTSKRGLKLYPIFGLYALSMLPRYCPRNRLQLWKGPNTPLSCCRQRVHWAHVAFGTARALPF